MFSLRVWVCFDDKQKMNGQTEQISRFPGGDFSAHSRQITRIDWPKVFIKGVVALALLLAIFGARPHAGSWNDGSRLAAVESLLDRGTLAIDDSMFVNPALSPAGHQPYPPHEADLRAKGTLDKLHIRGYFHSDKPPVVSVVMAAMYAPAQWLGLAPAPDANPERFIWILTEATSVAAFAVTLLSMHLLGQRIGLAGWSHAVWFSALALGTFALAYTRHVNNHILQLAVAAVWCLLSLRMADGDVHGWKSIGLGKILGTALGFGYNLDLGSGPLMFAAAMLLLVVRVRKPLPVITTALAASPWIVACHLTNWAIGGVTGPLNAQPEYLAWPGSPFSTGNMTGVMRHTAGSFLLYAASLLGGKHGILTHNLPLMLCLPALALIFRRGPWRWELLATLGWCGASWALYALMSNNHSGGSCSVRWFVPFLAPGFFLLAIYLKEHPESVADLAVLAGWGSILGLIMWTIGPWTVRMIPGLWPIVGAALASWLGLAIWRWRKKKVDQLSLDRKLAA